MNGRKRQQPTDWLLSRPGVIAQTTPRRTDVLLSCAVREITIDCQAEQVPSRAPAKSTRYARVLFLFLSFSLRSCCAPQRSHSRVTFSLPRSALGCSASDLSQTAAPSTVHTRSHTEYHTVCGNALPSSTPLPLLLPRRSAAADRRAKTRNYCGSSPCYAPS